MKKDQIKIGVRVEDYWHPEYGVGMICGERVSPVFVSVLYKDEFLTLEVEYPECHFDCLKRVYEA